MVHVNMKFFVLLRLLPPCVAYDCFPIAFFFFSFPWGFYITQSCFFTFPLLPLFFLSLWNEFFLSSTCFPLIIIRYGHRRGFSVYPCVLRPTHWANRCPNSPDPFTSANAGCFLLNLFFFWTFSPSFPGPFPLSRSPRTGLPS